MCGIAYKTLQNTEALHTKHYIIRTLFPHISYLLVLYMQFSIMHCFIYQSYRCVYVALTSSVYDNLSVYDMSIGVGRELLFEN